MRNRFFDPIYGPVPIDSDSMSLLLSPEMQRLRYIRMCNINSLLISGASEPSRFEHIVGVYHLVNIWADSHNLHSGRRATLCAAAILHDLQTGPFGHSMEYILDDNKIEGNFKHEDIKSGRLNSYFQRLTHGAAFSGAKFQAAEILGEIWGDVVEAIRGEGYIGPLISAEIDMDNIDNVVRLASHVGVTTQPEARIVALGLARNIDLNDRGLSVDAEGISLIQRWQTIRESLYKLLLWDWADFSAKAMLTRVMEDAVSLGKLSADSWILTDDGLISSLNESLKGEGGATKEILSRLVRGSLYEPVSLLRMAGTEHYDRLSNLAVKRGIEVSLAKVAGSACIFHPIKDKAKTTRAVSVHNRDTGLEEKVGESSNETLVGVFSVKSLGNSAKARTDRAVWDVLRNLPGHAAIQTLPDPIEDLFGEAALSTKQLKLFS